MLFTPMLSTALMLFQAGGTTPQPPAPGTAAPTMEVRALRETQAVASAKDAADDPAIWRDSLHPERSLIVATDKKAGLNVYDLSGRLRASYAAGRVNNVDLREVSVPGGRRIIVAASDRNDKTQGHVALFTLDPATAALTPLARIPAGPGEAYGFCLYRPRRGPLQAFVVMKEGAIVQLSIDPIAANAKLLRTMKLATQSEGCVADDRTDTLYVAEEDVGIWRFDARAEGAREGKLVAPADGVRLVADTEGLAIAARGRRGGWLLASSQGDSAYAAWRLPDMRYAGRFRVVDGVVDGTSETDGIEVSTKGFGPDFPRGIMIVQDGDNAPEAQNFKLIRWDAVRRALRR